MFRIAAALLLLAPFSFSVAAPLRKYEAILSSPKFGPPYVSSVLQSEPL